MARFEIDGERYEVPTLDSLTLHECWILYRLTVDLGAIVQEDFEAADPEWDDARREEHFKSRMDKFERPDFKLALAAIAYMREHPEAALEDARVHAGTADNLAFSVAFILGGDDVDPTMRLSLLSQSQPENGSSISGLSSPEATGTNSASDGTEPATPLETTGATRSDTSSPGAPRP